MTAAPLEAAVTISSNRYSLMQVNVHKMSAMVMDHNARGQASKLVSRSGDDDL